jgi:hypothetical protein
MVSCRFLLDERQRRKKNFLDCAFFAGPGLEPYQQCLWEGSAAYRNRAARDLNEQ